MNQEIKNIILKSNIILIIQADNPDADSLGSAIALENILTDLNKEVFLYCGVNIPEYLKYMTGWSRVSMDFPKNFDLAIIVDTSSNTLLGKISDSNKKKITNVKSIIIDHHDSDNSLPFDSKLIIDPKISSTAEIIYNIALEFNLKLNLETITALGSGILADTLGLSTSKTSSKTIRIIADMVDLGLDLSHLDSIRKESYKKSLELTKYKGELLQRIETYLDDKLAIIILPYEEIIKYSPIYNPSVLIMEDMRLIKNNVIAIALKIYPDSKITAKIRSNYGFPIANILAQKFGGGGHEYASGFKIYSYNDINKLKEDIIKAVNELLININENI